MGRPRSTEKIREEMVRLEKENATIRAHLIQETSAHDATRREVSRLRAAVLNIARLHANGS